MTLGRYPLSILCSRGTPPESIKTYILQVFGTRLWAQEGDREIEKQTDRDRERLIDRKSHRARERKRERLRVRRGGGPADAVLLGALSHGSLARLLLIQRYP